MISKGAGHHQQSCSFSLAVIVTAVVVAVVVIEQ
jgi:hypothetical protein